MLAALTLSVDAELLALQAVAERAAVWQLPVDAGGVRTVAVIQPRGGRVSQRGAAPRAALLRLRPLRLETGTLERHGNWLVVPVNSTAAAVVLTHHYMSITTLEYNITTV